MDYSHNIPATNFIQHDKLGSLRLKVTVFKLKTSMVTAVCTKPSVFENSPKILSKVKHCRFTPLPPREVLILLIYRHFAHNFMQFSRENDLNWTEKSQNMLFYNKIATLRAFPPRVT